MIILNKNTSNKTGMEIAVIGLAGKFPKSNGISEYWDNLKCGKECITFFDDSELHLSKREETLIDDPNYVKAKGFLDGKDLFDEKFFGYSKSEADIMEPQMRLFHECVWLALEDAGVETSKDNPIGLYGGAASDTFWKIAAKLRSMNDNLQTFSDEQLTNEEFMCTKIAYKLNLKGPAVYVKTACSTSMAAIHIACRGLLTGECKVAVAGGVSMLLPDKKGYLYREGMILSPDGHCRAFDDNSHGTVGGEGAGVVVLKRLKDAEADGDRIYAVIKGSAMNNDGADRVGYTAPGIIGQSTVIKKAYRIAKVDPETVTYIEAHGTGTEVGDPIEVDSLKEAFSTIKRNFCGIGSVKSNIGHLDSASGVAGFIKCVLSLYNKTLPPTINFEKPNKKIDFVNSPFYVNSTLKKWTAPDGILRAGVSSFGMGGTNVHVVLENYDYPEKEPNDDYKLLLFSAKNAESLNSMLVEWKEYLQKNPKTDMSEVAYVLENRRSHFDVHKAIGCFNSFDAVKKIETVPTESIKNNAIKDKKIVFLFPGQGNQYLKMCSGLYDHIPQFRSYVDECFEIQRKFGGDLKNIWLNGQDDDFLKTTISQPLIFIMEYSLSHYLIDLGINPDIVVGYSFGDYAAACIAGVFSLDDALYAINIRAKLMQETERGVMLNIPLNREKCEHYVSLIPNISIAIDNCDSCVVSGPVSAIEECEVVLKNDRIMSMRIGVDYGSHSHLMLPIIDRYKDSIEKISFHNNNIPIVSCITGEFLNSEDVTSTTYWSNHLKECVKFHKAMNFLDSLDEKYILVEVGPGRNLLSIAMRSIRKNNLVGAIDTIRIKSRDIPDVKYFYDKIGLLYDCGFEFASKINKEINAYDPVLLPNYSFVRNSFGSKYFTDDDFEANNVFTNNSTNSQMIYIQNWERTEQFVNTENTGKKWIIFADKNAISDDIVGMISKNNEISAFISSNDFDDSEKLITELFMGGEEYNILYSYGIKEYEETQKIYCDNLYKIANLCGSSSDNLKLCIFILCSNSIEAIGGDLKYPEKSLLNGALLVIPKEYSNINVKLIDIDKAEYKKEHNSACLKNIYNEFICNGDKTVALRRKYRLIPKYKEVTYQNDLSCIISNGVYILFGGAGGIGRLVADWLVKDYNANLIVCGRKPKDNRDLSLNNDHIEYCECDISDSTNVEGIFEYVLKKHGEINGIFNMAVVPDGKLIQMRTPSDSYKVLSPKYFGTNNIIDSCKKYNVKLMILFSSMSSLVGGVGQAAYCAANSYLDACAYYNENYNGIHTICIDWDRWKHTGVSNNLEKIHYKLTGNVMESGLEAGDAIELLKRCMHIEYPHLMAISQPIETFWSENEPENNVDVKNDYIREKLDRSSLSSELHPAKTDDERKLIELWENTLSIEPIGIEDDFLELGGDSLKAIIMLTKVEQIFHKKISVAGFLNQPTIKNLGDLIKKSDSIIKNERTIKYFDELDDNTKEYLNKNKEKYPFIDAYYLSPMQNIMLSYNLMNRVQGHNISIFEYTICGEMNTDLLKRAWKTIIEETPVLRLSFLWRRLNEPVQLIREKIEDNIAVLDLSNLSDAEYNARLLRIYDEEHNKNLNVTDYPLHNMIIIKHGQSEYRIIISYLNSLFDGWSANILLRKLQEYYLKLKEGESITTSNTKNDYFAALKMQRDNQISNANDFWKKDFIGFLFDESQCFNINEMSEESFSSLNAVLDNKKMKRISDYVRANKITLNSYFQGCWALLISEYEQSNDTLTGYVSSGRDSFSDDMIDCVGLFTNIVPLRTIIDENNNTNEYFVNVHKHINNVNQNSSVVISEIEKIVDAPKGFFERISYNKTLTFIQYPVEKKHNLNFTVESVVSETSVHVPLRMYVNVDNEIEIKINYSNDYTDNYVKGLLRRYITIVENGVDKVTLKELKI